LDENKVQPNFFQAPGFQSVSEGLTKTFRLVKRFLSYLLKQKCSRRLSFSKAVFSAILTDCSFALSHTSTRIWRMWRVNWWFVS